MARKSMRQLKDRYRALDYAYAVVWTKNPVIVKVSGAKNQYRDRRWIHFFVGRKEVGDCNPVFFENHFVKARDK